MSEYRNIISLRSDLSMQDVIDVCKSLVPCRYSHRPYRYPELENGVALLHSEDGLNCYMAAYGEMHMMKCRAALQNFPFEEIRGVIEIVDWGCGQGIGSMCVIDALKQRDLFVWLKRVTLVEPSKYAMERAETNLVRATNGTIRVIPVERYLPGDEDSEQDEIEGIEYGYENVIHVFSNILDVDGINLYKLAQLVADKSYNHFILCTSPMNGGAYRIEQFCSLFGAQHYFSDIHDRQFGRTSDTHYIFTCKTKCFRYDGTPLDLANMENVPISESDENNGVAYNEYDPRMAVQNGVISEDLRSLYLIVLSLATPHDVLLIKPNINGDIPDLVVANPEKGILIINIFDKDLNDLDMEENRYLSPIDAISAYQTSLSDYLGEKISIVKKMILFTQNSTCEAKEKYVDKYTSVFGKDWLCDRSKWSRLFDEIRFKKTGDKRLNDKWFNNFLNLVSRNWHPYRQGKQITLTAIQQNLSKSIAGKMQKISGVAGSGKTQVLATRAVNAQVRTGGNVLVLTYNKTLSNYLKNRINEVRADFYWDKIQIDYYHQFFRRQALNCGLRVRCNSYDDTDFFKEHDEDLQKYEAIFIDEVQDYKTEWLQLLSRYFLVENGEFVVFGDPKQNIYKRELDKNGDIRLGVIGGEWNKQLKNGKRFSNMQLTKFVTDFQRAYFKDMPVDSFENAGLIQGSIFVGIQYVNLGRNVFTEDIVKQLVAVIEKNGFKEGETVVMSQTVEILQDVDSLYREETGEKTVVTFAGKESRSDTQQKLRFTMAGDELKLSTIQSFKGWEANNVILLLEPDGTGKGYTVSPTLERPELIYTAITRAKENLVIINLGNTKYHSFFVQKCN